VSDASGDGARARVPADGVSGVNSEVVSVSLSTNEPHAQITSGGEDTVARVREDAVAWPSDVLDSNGS
jgi:hypothetical protein